MPPALSEDGWEQAKAAGPLLAAFWAEWCVPSLGMAPLLDAAEQELRGRVRVALVDHEANPRLAERYKILGLPTLILLQGGVEVQRRVGLPDLAAIREMVRAGLGG